MKVGAFSALLLVATICVVQAGAISPAVAVHPLTCGTVLYASAVLTGNLNCSGYGSTAIYILAAGVTLNCAGFKIIGSNSQAAVYIGNYFHDTVESCNITGAHWGIVVDEGGFGTITGNTISLGTYGVYVTRFTYADTISHNMISTEQYGIYVGTSASGNTILSNTVKGCEFGIRAYYSDMNTYSGNLLVGNTYSIYAYESTSDTIVGNTFKASTYGIYMYGSTFYTIGSNLFSHNTFGAGLFVSSESTLTQNTFVGNGEYGVYICYTSNYNTVVSNSISGSYEGVNINTCGGSWPANNSFAHNVINLNSVPVDDDSFGGGTFGTANFYSDHCSSNSASSDPVGLC